MSTETDAANDRTCHRRRRHRGGARRAPRSSGTPPRASPRLRFCSPSRPTSTVRSGRRARRSPDGRTRRSPGAARSCSAFRELLERNVDELARMIASEHGKVRRRRQGRDRARPRGGRVRLRPAAAAEGRVLRRGVDGDRRSLLPPAARGVRRNHAVQLPGDGPDVDAPGRHRHGQHLRPQAIRAGPVGLEPDRRALPRGRPARRGLQRRPRRQGRGRCDPRPSRHRGGLLRRLDPDRALRPRARDAAGQACPGARWRQEPRRRDARRRPRLRRRPADGRRLRLGRPAMHGDLGASSPSATAPIRCSSASPPGRARSRSAPASTRTRKWGPWSPPPHASGSSATSSRA